MTASRPCPPWCNAHVELSDSDYHQSTERIINGQVIMLTGPDGTSAGKDGGIFFFRDKGYFPARQMTRDETIKAIEDFRASARGLTEVANALEQAMRQYYELEPIR